ncbi:MAG: hypothetical protein DMF73_09855 [Acidobacteria bacterium]|nr:MAG: hypothetical protein DMF73_09855 [Acidobacteriota bacterium]
MFESNPSKTEELDRAGKLILMAAAASDSEIEAAASSPFLFTRLRAGIDEERRRREESNGWLSLIQVAWRAVPAMALVAILAAVLTVWSAKFDFASTPQAEDEPLIGALDPGVEQTVLASRNGLSRDEVFNIVLDRNYGANAK